MSTFCVFGMSKRDVKEITRCGSDILRGFSRIFFFVEKVNY